MIFNDEFTIRCWPVEGKNDPDDYPGGTDVDAAILKAQGYAHQLGRYRQVIVCDAALTSWATFAALWLAPDGH